MNIKVKNANAGHIKQFISYFFLLERVIKTSGDDEGIFVNGVFSGARTSTDNFTAYINPYLVVTRGGNYTKPNQLAKTVSIKISNNIPGPGDPDPDGTGKGGYTGNPADAWFQWPTSNKKKNN
jgi:hypothetical protein